MKKILFLLLVISSYAKGQNTYAEYDVLVTDFTKLKTKIETDQKDLKELIDLFSNNEFYFEYKMKVISNCKHALFLVSLKYSNYPGFKKDSLAVEKYFIDYEKNTIYDIANKTFSHYKPDVILKNNHTNKDTVFNTLVINQLDTAIISFDKRLPKCLTNKILLKNNEYGISKIKTKKQLIVLTTHRNNNYDLDNCFKLVEQVCVKETSPFNGLFLK